MPILVSYDIDNDKLRLRVANKLLEYGSMRLQRSVFLGNPAAGLWNQLYRWMQEEVHPHFTEADNVLHLQMTELQMEAMFFVPAPPSAWTELTDPPNTLII